MRRSIKKKISINYPKKNYVKVYEVITCTSIQNVGAGRLRHGAGDGTHATSGADPVAGDQAADREEDRSIAAGAAAGELRARRLLSG